MSLVGLSRRNSAASNESGTPGWENGSAGELDCSGRLILCAGDVGPWTGGCEGVDPIVADEAQEVSFTRTDNAIHRTRRLLPNLSAVGVGTNPSPPEQQIHCIPDLSTYLHDADNNVIISIPRPPTSNRAPHVSFFLPFHRAKIIPAHYFAWYDYNHFYTQMIHSMAEESRALQYALVAFSALVYSVKMARPTTRLVAFTYYTMAIRELQGLLNELVQDTGKGEMAIATALQLATFDVTPYPPTYPTYPCPSCFVYTGMDGVDGSAFGGIRVNVFDTWLVWRVSYNQSRVLKNYLRRHLDRRYWDGTALLRIIIVFLLPMTLFFLDNGEAR